MIINIQCDESTLLKEISYHKSIEKNVGAVIAIFKNNEMYLYEDVDISSFMPLIHNKLISIGAAFNNYIKNKYTGKNITDKKENSDAESL